MFFQNSHTFPLGPRCTANSSSEHKKPNLHRCPTPTPYPDKEWHSSSWIANGPTFPVVPCPHVVALKLPSPAQALTLALALVLRTTRPRSRSPCRCTRRLALRTHCPRLSMLRIRSRICRHNQVLTIPMQPRAVSFGRRSFLMYRTPPSYPRLQGRSNSLEPTHLLL